MSKKPKEKKIIGVPAKKRGRPAFIPTDEQRQTVIHLKACGYPVESMCKLLGIKKTLFYNKFKEELELGLEESNADVASSVLKAAKLDPDDPNYGSKNVQAAKFWLEARHPDFKRHSSVHIDGTVDSKSEVDIVTMVDILDQLRNK